MLMHSHFMYIELNIIKINFFLKKCSHQNM